MLYYVHNTLRKGDYNSESLNCYSYLLVAMEDWGLTVKFIGLILLILLIGTLIHVLLWPAILLAVIILGAGLFTN